MTHKEFEKLKVGDKIICNAHGHRGYPGIVGKIYTITFIDPNDRDNGTHINSEEGAGSSGWAIDRFTVVRNRHKLPLFL